MEISSFHGTGSGSDGRDCRCENCWLSRAVAVGRGPRHSRGMERDGPAEERDHPGRRVVGNTCAVGPPCACWGDCAGRGRRQETGSGSSPRVEEEVRGGTGVCCAGGGGLRP